MSDSQADSQTPSNTDAQLEQEIAAALGDQSVDDLMAQDEARQAAASDEASQESQHEDKPDGEKKQARPSSEKVEFSLKRGRILSVRGDDVFVELAGVDARLQGVVPASQFDRPPRLGSIMDFVVDRIDEDQGLMHLSREGAVSVATWEHLDRGSVVEARVVGHNKGGLELEMPGNINSFMPASQIDRKHIDDFSTMVGEKLTAVVQEIDRRAKKLVLSRRQHLEQQREAQRAKVLGELEEGQTREGVVSGLVPYGAFIDLGGVDGLVHISDLSYTHVDKPEEVVKEGQTVRVKVLKVNAESEKIKLGLKQVEPDPWEEVLATLKVADVISGKVVRNVEFGSFVEIRPGVEGLAPISELSWSRIRHPNDIVKEGDTIRVKVLQIEPDRRRISLSLKQAEGDPWIGAEGKYARNSLVEGKVVRIVDFGAFVELEPGVEALAPIAELSKDRINRVEQVLNEGETRQFRVLVVDEEQRRARLSVRAVEDPAAAESAPQQPDKSRARVKKRDPSTLRGGIGSGGGMGTGLGDLKL